MWHKVANTLSIGCIPQIFVATCVLLAKQISWKDRNCTAQGEKPYLLFLHSCGRLVMFSCSVLNKNLVSLTCFWLDK